MMICVGGGDAAREALARLRNSSVLNLLGRLPAQAPFSACMNRCVCVCVRFHRY